MTKNTVKELLHTVTAQSTLVAGNTDAEMVSAFVFKMDILQDTEFGKMGHASNGSHKICIRF